MSKHWSFRPVVSRIAKAHPGQVQGSKRKKQNRSGRPAESISDMLARCASGGAVRAASSAGTVWTYNKAMTLYKGPY